MRTSSLQYALMVDFMEKHGDLSKPGLGPRGRHYIQLKWKELSDKLNSEGSWDSRPEEKWRKVWSDFKNNCKKKLAKINRAAGGTGGGPALQLSLTEVENRVIQIIGVQAATGLEVPEAGFPQNVEEKDSFITKNLTETLDDWNTPSTSELPTVVVPPNLSHPSTSPVVQYLNEPTDEHWKPPQKRKKHDTAQLFLEYERSMREHARERDRMLEKLERERLRQRDEELRLRELELQLQAQWQVLFTQALRVIERLFEWFARRNE